jgi:hypothetical protein
MTVDEIKKRIAAIEAMKADDEAAHGAEDELYQDVLYAIAGGRCDDARACANEVLKTKEIEFSRWCA